MDEQENCSVCGEFEISAELEFTMPGWIDNDPEKSTKVGHTIKRMQEHDEIPLLTDHMIENILERDLPAPKEQADLFIRWLGENLDGPGEIIHVEPHKHRMIIGAKTPNGFKLILEYLLNQELIEGILDSTISPPQHVGQGKVTLSVDGWVYFEALKRGFSSGNKAFMAMQYGDKELESVYQKVFKKAANEAGFKLYKSSENPKAGLIDNKMRVEIQNATFIIADLTHDNYGAYWEAGYAEGLGKDVIYTCKKTKFDTMKTHFDTNHHLTIVWDQEEPEKAGEELKASIRATLPHLVKMEDQ